MAYTDRPLDRGVDRPTTVAIADYHDRVRWGPILAGLMVAVTTQLILTGLGTAIGMTGLAGSGAPRTNADNVGWGIGIWSIISLLISLFVGGWVTARACGPMNRNTGLLNGAVLWATTLAISAWLLATGVSGAFGILASNAGEVINQSQQAGVNPATVLPNANVTAQEARNFAGNAATAGWTFTIGSLLGLVAALIGASLGTRTPRDLTRVTTTPT